MYVQQSEVEKLKKVFSGKVLPLESYTGTGMNPLSSSLFNNSNAYDL